MVNRTTCLLAGIAIFIGFTSCDFNITDSPGPQMSFSIDESKSHDTFLAEYAPSDSLVNGFRINSVFIERRFWRKEGFLLRKQINCCKSQLVIITDDGVLDYGRVWALKGFAGARSSYSICKELEGVVSPDSIPIEVIAIKGNDSSEIKQKFVLHKVIESEK